VLLKATVIYLGTLIVFCLLVVQNLSGYVRRSTQHLQQSQKDSHIKRAVICLSRKFTGTEIKCQVLLKPLNKSSRQKATD